ncbi:unnamed protein product [Urochloa decumbens]|uniref:Cysteine-rich receptor-like protein kinase 10 n=1 Tax=Urochloa decumbens TaxID=240449 RepID=A0ABC8ZXI5_9POAL
MHSLLPLLALCLSIRCLTTRTNADDLRFYVYYECPSNMNYTRRSAFQANLDATISSLPAAAAASYGFAENTTGAAPDEAYGLAQCRGDINASECRSCLADSAREIGSSCPGQKSAMLVYEGCLLCYSNASCVPGTSDPVPVPNDTNVTQPEQFMSQLNVLMDDLTRKAAYGSPRMFAAGSANHTLFVTIYGMAQCTRDTAPDDCGICLALAVKTIPKCCEGKEGGRIFVRRCWVRFEIYPFYNEQAAEAAMSPTPPPVNDSDISRQQRLGSNRTVRTALLVSIPVAVALMVLLPVAVYLLKGRRKPHKNVQIASATHGDGEETRSSESLLYDLSTLRAATDNFSVENKLGEGGFGPVYKGTLQNGQQIAVKRLSAASQQGQAEMKNEIVLVAKLQHRNMVRLLGCCVEEHERILVYEFLRNKSLDKILFDPARQNELTWGQRYKIIEGIGRGLLYLHEDSRLTIIHRDLKASNILLDADMNPKISDFGLARLFNMDSSVGNTKRIAGTYGYMAPEYALRGIFSTKSDVYSYGVLVLEIVTGRRPSENLINFVWGHWSRGSVPQLLEGCPAGPDGPGPQETLRCIHVGLLCVQDDPQLRPSMASVVVMLNSRSITLPAPTEPAFAFVMNPGEGPRAPPQEPSINDASVSDLNPR